MPQTQQEAAHLDCKGPSSALPKEGGWAAYLRRVGAARVTGDRNHFAGKASAFRRGGA